MDWLTLVLAGLGLVCTLSGYLLRSLHADLELAQLRAELSRRNEQLRQAADWINAVAEPQNCLERLLAAHEARPSEETCDA